MPDRIVTATAENGSFSVVAGDTTELVREAQMRHELAPTATAALGRLFTAGALLGTSLKGRERMTLQILSNGPLRGLVADVWLANDREIDVRGYARVPDVDVPLNARGKFDVARAVGGGRMQVTRSFEVGQPYVGVVPLASGEIGDDIAAYLAASQQIPSVVAVGVLIGRDGVLAAGGAIAQVQPGADESTIAMLEARALEIVPVTQQLNEGASPEDLVRSLAGDLPTRVLGHYEPRFACRCTRERVETALLGLGRDGLAKMAAEQPETEAVCEYCRKRYVLSSDDVHDLIERLEAGADG